MSKYVGKIFRVKNSDLHIRGNDTHFVHVQYYNPFSRKFYCRVITSLERDVPKTMVDKDFLKNNYAFYNKKTKKYNVLNKDKYRKLRNGYLQAIPLQNCDNFKRWSAYSKSIYLHRSKLTKQTLLKIKKG